MVTDAEVHVLRCGGSRINLRRALFSGDDKYLLCVSGDSIKVFSTATDECLHVLWSHQDLVTGIQLNPNNPLQLFSCSLDGTVKLWDFLDGIVIKTFLIELKLFGLYASASADCIYAICQSGNSKKKFDLMSLKLPKSTGQECKVTQMTVLFTDVHSSPKCTAVGREGEYIVTVRRHSLFVYFLKSKKTFRFSLSVSTKQRADNTFTVVACHPTEDCIATGHKDGRIRLWRNFNHNRDYTNTSLHWHYDYVADLAFSAQGTVLFSGGVECVLVQWSHTLEHRKEFLPRLGATIEHIVTSPSGSLLCTSHVDNKITIINPNLEVVAIIQGLVRENQVKTGLMFDPRTKALVLNGRPGHLQFYSLHDDRQLYSMDIVQQEFVNEAHLQHMDLVKAAFNTAGNWLATVEELKRKESNHLDMQMKFWEYDEQLQSFVLNTTINLPHEDQITSLCFQCGCDSDPPTLVTTGEDGLFKVWVLEDNSDIYRQSSGWSCLFLGSYHGFKAMTCSFSEDGSLLAVGFEDVITIWETSSWDLKHTFCQPPGKIRSLCFGRMSSSKYLVSSTENGFISCWDLLTCNLSWKAQLNASVLQPDCSSENIAAFTTTAGRSTSKPNFCSIYSTSFAEDTSKILANKGDVTIPLQHQLLDGSIPSNQLFIFTPTDPQPLYVHADVCRGCVKWATFVPRDLPEVLPSKSHKWLIKSQLYFLTESQDLMTFGTKSPEKKLKPLSKQLATEESLPFTPFFTLLGRKLQEKQVEQKMDVPLEKSALTKCRTWESPAIKELLHTPAHVLPPAAVLCSLFVDSLLISQQKTCTEQDNQDLDIESEKAEDDSDEDQHEDMLTGDFCTTPLKLLKHEEKELRRIRRKDFTWVSVL